VGARDWVVKKLSSPTLPSVDLYGASSTQILKAGGKITVDSSQPIGIKTTPTIPRAPKAELEAAYVAEPNMFNAINKTTQLVMAAGYRLLGDDESVSFFEEFFDEIGTRGGEMEWQELLTSVYKHQMVYGEAWNELIPAKRDKNRIVDLQLRDPKKMNYTLNANDKIVLDAHGDPVGYVETLPMEYAIAEKRFVAPKEVAMQANQIFFPPSALAHYRLYTIGDGFYGVGLIEPSYKTIVRKLSMEEALANAVNRTGFPRLHASVGKEGVHEPTEEQIQRLIEKLKNADNMNVFAYPYYVDLKILQANRPEALQEHLTYYINQIVTGTGLPRALATGMGEETNRATLNRQEALAKLTLKDIIRRTVRVIEKDIIKPVAESNNVNPVKILWGEISIEELDGKAERLVAYTGAGLLSYDEGVEALIRKLEDLPERGKNAKKPKVKANEPGNK